MGWLIDTSLWIAVERGAIPVNLAEMRFGLELLSAGRQKQRAAAMLRRLRRKPILRITAETADTFGTLDLAPARLLRRLHA